MNHAPFNRRTFLKHSLAAPLALVGAQGAAFSSDATGAPDRPFFCTPDLLLPNPRMSERPCPYSDRLLIVALEGSADSILCELLGMLDRGQLPVEEVAGHWNFQIDVLDEHSIKRSLGALLIGQRCGNRLSASSHVLVLASDNINGYVPAIDEISKLRRYCETLATEFGASVRAANLKLNAVLIRNPDCTTLPIANDFICRVAEEVYLDGPPMEINSAAFSKTSERTQTERLAAVLWEKIRPLAGRVVDSRRRRSEIL